MEDGGGTLSSVFDFFCTLVLSLKFLGAFVPIVVVREGSKIPSRLICIHLVESQATAFPTVS